MTEKTKSQKNVSSRQKIRKLILIISFLLIPVTIFYISPIIPMMGASEGIVTGSLILFIILFLSSLFVGRLWCGWLCPMGGWQEICSPAIRRKVKDGWRNKIKYGVLVLWLIVIGLSFAGAGGIQTVDPFYGTVNGMSITSLEILAIVAFIFLFIIIVAFITGRRGFCHVFCPMAVLMIIGRRIGNFIGWPAFRLSSDATRCDDCKKCSGACPMGLDVNAMVREEKTENPECIFCANCADICPNESIRFGVKGRDRIHKKD